MLAVRWWSEVVGGGPPLYTVHPALVSNQEDLQHNAPLMPGQTDQLHILTSQSVSQSVSPPTSLLLSRLTTQVLSGHDHQQTLQPVICLVAAVSLTVHTTLRLTCSFM